MPNEFGQENDPKNLWQRQPTEGFRLSAEEIRIRAHRLHSKARMEALSWIVIGAVLSFLFARSFFRVEDAVPRIGWAILSLWSLYGIYQAYRWIWPRRLAPDSTASATLDFYRKELERRRDYGRHIWRRSGLAFCFAGVAMIAGPGLIYAVRSPKLLWNVVPFFAILAIWFASFLTMRKRGQRKLQEEIDALNAFERRN